MLRWQPMASMVTIVPLNSPRPLSLSTKSLPANVLDSALPADRAPQQNTSGDSPYPLLIHFLPSAYSNLYASPLCLPPAHLRITKKAPPAGAFLGSFEFKNLNGFYFFPKRLCTSFQLTTFHQAFF